MSEFLIEAVELRKSFKGQLALDGLDLLVPAGSVFGFLGRNGAGKTTTIKLLMGLLNSDGGTVNVFGLPVGVYDIAVFMHSTVTGTFNNVQVVRVTVR